MMSVNGPRLRNQKESDTPQMKSVLVTGANAGLGKESARQLALLDSIERVYLGCRTIEKAAAAGSSGQPRDKSSFRGWREAPGKTSISAASASLA